jgi:hypothetical protein
LSPVGLRQLPVLAEHLGRIVGHALEQLGGLSLVLSGEYLFSLQRPLELPHVERVHAVEPVEVRRLERCHAHITGRSRHPSGETGRQGEAVWAAA